MEELAHEVSGERTLRGASGTGRTQPIPQNNNHYAHPLQQTQLVRPQSNTPPPKNRPEPFKQKD